MNQMLQEIQQKETTALMVFNILINSVVLIYSLAPIVSGQVNQFD